MNFLKLNNYVEVLQELIVYVNFFFSELIYSFDLKFTKQFPSI